MPLLEPEPTHVMELITVGSIMHHRPLSVPPLTPAQALTPTACAADVQRAERSLSNEWRISAWRISARRIGAWRIGAWRISANQ